MDIKSDNGWLHINDVKPGNEESVIVVLERESCPGCAYDFKVCESIYKFGHPRGYFLCENGSWNVRYWRRKNDYPYPQDVVRKGIEDCKRRMVSPEKIIEHQRKCGIEIEQMQYENE